MSLKSNLININKQIKIIKKLHKEKTLYSLRILKQF
jgi:hypothetical protein